MSDFRIYDLEDNQSVYGYDSVFLVDSNTLGRYSAKNYDVKNTYDKNYFVYKTNNIENDYTYYTSKIDYLSGGVIKIKTDGNNIKFTKNENVYIPSGRSYDVSSNEDGDYGYYFDVDVSKYDYKVDYVLSPNIYSKDKIDTSFEGVKFDLKSDSNVLEVTTSKGTGNILSSFDVKNNYLFTKSYTQYIPGHGNIHNYIISIFNDNDKISGGTFSLGDCEINKNVGLFSINKNQKFISNGYYSMVVNEKQINHSGDNGIYIFGDGVTGGIKTEGGLNIVKSAIGKDNYGRPSLIVTDYMDYDKVRTTLFIGGSENPTISANTNNFVFNRNSTYGFYADKDGSFFFGTLDDKIGKFQYPKQVIAFGDRVEPYNTLKFQIVSRPNERAFGDECIFCIDKWGNNVMYNGVDLIHKKDDVYVASSYWDMVIHKEELSRDVLYYN